MVIMIIIIMIINFSIIVIIISTIIIINIVIIIVSLIYCKSYSHLVNHKLRLSTSFKLGSWASLSMW